MVVAAGRLEEVPGHSHLHKDLEDSLGYVKPYLNKILFSILESLRILHILSQRYRTKIPDWLSLLEYGSLHL